MKKSLIALAVLGALSGAASAQSSVTLYGIIDIGPAVERARCQQGCNGPASELVARERVEH